MEAEQPKFDRLGVLVAALLTALFKLGGMMDG